MPENGQENLEPLQPDDNEEDTVLEIDSQSEPDKFDLVEIEGEPTLDTLKRARELIKPINSKIKGLELEYKNYLSRESSGRADEIIAKDIEEIRKLREAKERIEAEAKRQIFSNKKFREGK